MTFASVGSPRYKDIGTLTERNADAMRELIADLFVSADGFAAGVNSGPYFGYSGPDLEAWVHTGLDQPHTVVMGRVTYEAMAGISAGATDDVSTRMNELPKIAVSNTLREPLTWSNTRLLTGDLADGIRALKEQPGNPLRSIGSITLVRNMIRLGLVDRLRLMVFPLILGVDGREPFHANYPATGLELLSTQLLDLRIVLLEYRPARSAGD